MMQGNKMIPSFEPYNKIIVGSNEVNCKYLFRFSSFIPIIIGKTTKGPTIWLNAINGDNIIPIVVNNVSLSKNILLKFSSDLPQIEIYMNNSVTGINNVILKATYTNQIFIIQNMDLRFLGIDVLSFQDRLVVGKNLIKDNVVVGAETFIGGK